MKIGILTQPLVTNYGGLLQAYALQKYLIKNDFEVLTVDIRPKKPKL
ncbi:TPA: polysaccharide pyruvyl transferase family protein, partial [Proteus mirabilis]|nr:polysaccharide pyruvyl transferase family protein [Proteus mirabilis]